VDAEGKRCARWVEDGVRPAVCTRHFRWHAWPRLEQGAAMARTEVVADEFQTSLNRGAGEQKISSGQPNPGQRSI